MQNKSDKNSNIENQLKATQAKIESIFKAAPIGIGLVVNRIIKEANDRLCDMLGYARKELIDKSARMLYPTEEEYLRVGKVKYSLIEEHGTGSIETKWKCRNGKVIDILLSSTPLDINDLSTGVTFTALDITETKKALFSLRMSEQRFRNIANYTYGWENWISSLGTLLWVNPAVERITGYSVDECMRMDDYPFSLIHPEDTEMVQIALSAAIKGTQFERLEFRIIHKNKKVVWVSMCCQPVFDEKNVSQGIRVSLLNITPRKKLDLAIHSFLKFTSYKFGNDFFDSLTSNLVQTLDADIALIGQLSKGQDNTIETLSVNLNGKKTTNFSYILSGTPCEDAIKNKKCICFKGAAKQFPNDSLVKEKNIEAYVGLALFDSLDCPLGLAAVLFKKPLKRVDFIEDVLQLFASRTAAEIERNTYEKAFIYRLTFEDLITEIATSFIDIESDRIDEKIELALEKMAEFVKADTGYVFMFSNDLKTFSLTHIWQNKYIQAEKQFLQEIETSSMPWWISRISSNTPVVVPSIDKLPKAATYERQLISRQNIKSAVDVPLMYNNTVLGFLGFGSTFNNRNWTEDDISLLKILGKIIANALMKKIKNQVN